MRLSYFVKLSGALILTTGLAGTASAQSYSHSQNGYSAHEACKSSESRSKVIGGGIGAVAGAVLGSQVAGNGARTEASVIGGVLGGLAGAGIADKRVDCDPVYTDTQSSSTYSASPTYGSSPIHGTSSRTYGTTTGSSGYHQSASSYPHEDYGTRTTVSDHPVYSNPTWGAQPARTYVTQTQPVQTVSQPVYRQATYQQATYQQPTYSQPRYVNTATQYQRPVQTTTYTRPRTTYVQPRTVTRRVYSGYGRHQHGKYSCSDRH
jgi:hypothetical protein